MPPILRAALAAGFIVAAAPAAAGTQWLCHLDDEAVRLICIADDAVPTGESGAPGVRVRGTAFPLDPARLWTVDLWTPPSDMEFVGELARATICYRSPGCSVEVMAPRETRAISRPARASRPTDGRAG
jgi:hypothetical protein